MGEGGQSRGILGNQFSKEIKGREEVPARRPRKSGRGKKAEKGPLLLFGPMGFFNLRGGGRQV